ncbi:MAG: dihydrofolate reductase family protein [Anaerolineales bacterium]|nr:dihydrofolate reductase family protein [Anaerolineales bacterium]
MRKLTATTFVTLDGVMQGPGGPGEDDTNGFSSGGWSVKYWDPTLDEVMTATFAKQPDLLLGRKTYQTFAGYWPTATEPGAEDLNNARKYVASRTLDKVEWQNSTLLPGDLAAAVQALKAQPGPEIQVHGSSDLLQTLLRLRLVDEMQVLIFPVTVGRGKRLFGETVDPTGYKLLDTRVSATGVIIARYAPAGALQTGTFGQ